MTLTYIKNGETLSLDAEKCAGCGACVDVCPHSVFAIEEKKARIIRREACMECGACARNCPFGALEVEAGVGCAGAIIMGKLKGTAPTCGGDSGCCGAPAKKKACC